MSLLGSFLECCCRSDISVFYVKEGISWRMYLVIIYAALQAEGHLNSCDTSEESGKYLINYVGSEGGRKYLMCLGAIC